MNPLNTPQYYITGMQPLTSTTSILKSNVSAAVSTGIQKQSNTLTTFTGVGSCVKSPATGNNLLDTTKYVTNANYMPVLLTNQTLITSVDPANYQQQQLGPVATSTSNSHIPLISGNANQQLVLNTPSTAAAAANITYQVLSSAQNNSLNPAITAPNGTVSVLLASTQPMATAGHVAAPIIIRNTAATTTVNHKGQIKPQTQQKTNQQTFNTDILKQIIVGNPGNGVTPAVLAPGTTLLKPTILQNNKNSKMMITAHQQQQQHHQMQQNHNNHTIITTSSDNSSQMFAALGVELVKNSNVTQAVQKLPQVSLLQNTTKRSSNNTETINESVTATKTPNEIKVGNLSSEVSLIKKPNVSSSDVKTQESSLLKTSNKIQAELLEKRKKDCLQINSNTYNNKEIVTGDEASDSSSLLKSNQDMKDLKKCANEGDNILDKSCNAQIEKQKSLLKPQISYKKTSETPTEDTDRTQLTSPRSQRSNSYNTLQKPSAVASATNTERRHSEPSNGDLVANLKITKDNNEGDQYRQEPDLIKSQELEMFFEDEEYLESSGDKSPVSSEKYNDNANKSPIRNKENFETSVTARTEIKTLTTPKEIENTNVYNTPEIYNEEKKDIEGNENTKNKLSHDYNDEANSSGYDDDDVTILPAEEVEIEQIEIYDDDDDGKDVPQTNLRTSLEEKEHLNQSLLCDEQFLVSSSSSISNNSSDQNSATALLIKSPLNDHITTPLLKKTLMQPTKVLNQKEEPQSNGYSSVLDMLSNFNMLSWRERIGTARGTKLKFQLNEFNLIQLYEKSMPNKRIHTAYEKPIYERESSQKKNESKEPLTYYMCKRCNVQGPSVDFLAPEFCSLSCLKRDCRKRREDTASIIRKRNRLNNSNNFPNKNYNSNYINETTSNISNPPPLTYIRKPKFRWTTYMNRNYNVIAAPISLFLNPFPTGPNSFLVGMKLEAIDPENCSLFCVCTVVGIMGYRLKLSFDGYSNAYDFWLNADSMDIFPPGWCAKTNRILQPPKGIAAGKFNWGSYLGKEKALPAPRHLFTHLNSSSVVPRNPFKVGMHLEAEDLNDTGKLCVASIADVLDDRIRIHFDGWDDCYDIIVDINSPYIHPCGWHEGRQQLVVPPDCENGEFNWNDYIRKQGTEELGNEELFAPREPIGFKPNMRLEVVDPRNPSLIRPATVVSHKGHRVKLHLDGWPSDYCFWLEDDSPDLHPIGWCDATGHDLEPPPGFQISKQKMPCPVDGCRGIGNAKNVFNCFHASREGCPYAAENWRTVVEKPQRVNYENIVRTLPKQGKHTLAQQLSSLQSRLSDQQILERLQILDNIKTRNVLVQQDKLPTSHNDFLGNFSIPHLKNEEIKETKISKTVSSTSASTQHQDSHNNSLNVNVDISREFLYDYGPRLQQNFNLWQKNFSFDADKIKRNPLDWSTTEVSVFVELYLSCRQTATIFIREEIDGEAFLLLQQQDLTEKLEMKLGPAVKLYTCILQLRTLAVTKFEVPYKRLVAKKQNNLLVDLQKF